MRNFCKYCGKPLNPGEECTCQESRQERNAAQSAGIPNSYYQNYNTQQKEAYAGYNNAYKEKARSNLYDVNALSIVSLLMAACNGGILIATGAIIFSVLAKKGMKEQDILGKRMATIGLVFGIIEVVIGVIVLSAQVGGILALSSSIGDLF